MNLIDKMDAIEAIRAAENCTPDDLKEKEAAAYRMGLRAAVAVVDNCRSVEDAAERICCDRNDHPGRGGGRSMIAPT